MARLSFDHRVQFERSAKVDTGLSDREVFAAHGAPVWADRSDVSDGERWVAQQVAASITSRFTVRRSAFTAGITAADRLRCDGLTFDIAGVKESPRGRRFVEISATARPDLKGAGDGG
ncbi:phage head-tail adapter protein [Loktanella sp. 3ANDIMAR09]|uniref:head-tail adaptor protein n=1 Tax=Loktanella sp. 3ANDIMAR09 TaxID=1225657 RepID=UPI0006F97227|nr:head-tail adaptor protein [Loktanella sp. 3ANDIMAR09]KQI66964.1 phage head-tail adapter protein [Loktanella sp. 3ANDIMAR09]